MSLREVMEFIQKLNAAGTADTPDTPLIPVGYQRKPNAHAACTPDTPDTPVFDNAQVNAQKTGPAAAANDGAMTSPPAPAPMPEVVDWRMLDAAYQAHHAHCHVCQVAGRGVRYGLRCGVGASLWSAYTAAVSRPGALPWQPASRRGSL